MKRREEKRKGEKERYTDLNAEFQRIGRGDKKDFLRDQCKEIDLIDRVSEELWTEVPDTVQEAGIKTIPKKKKCKKAKWLSEEAYK